MLSAYPTKLDKDSLSSEEWIKERTIELYNYLPQTTLEERSKYIDIRDEVINLNYKFFGYVASATFVSNTSVEYEDKFQSAISHFCTIWPKFKFEQEYKKGKKYRTDLAFSVFFKPRLSEEIQREFNDVKYATERTLKMKAGAQLGKHWSKVTYEDLKNVHLPESEMQSLKSIFGCMYWTDMEKHEQYIQSERIIGSSLEQLYTDKYDSPVDLLVHTMIDEESLIVDVTLLKIAEINGLSFEELKKARVQAEKKLQDQLVSKIELMSTFENRN